jgi:large subunit ribosomal protein L5
MNSLNQLFKKNLKYNLLNRFHYRKTKHFPKLEKIVLNFGLKTTETKQLINSLLVLELITKQKATLTVTKYSNILLKIRKGNPIGCKVTLRKNSALNFLDKMSDEIFPKFKNTKQFFKISKKIKKNNFSYNLHEIFNFQELENKFYLFTNLPKLDITLITNSKIKEELIFLLRTVQIPIK